MTSMLYTLAALVCVAVSTAQAGDMQFYPSLSQDGTVGVGFKMAIGGESHHPMELAQADTQQPQLQNQFFSQIQCERAHRSGEFVVYSPTKLDGFAKEPTGNYVVQKVNSWSCVDTDAENGRRWVVLPPGTEFRFWKNADGSIRNIPYQIHACGNHIYTFLPMAGSPARTPAPASSYVGGDTIIINQTFTFNESQQLTQSRTADRQTEKSGWWCPDSWWQKTLCVVGGAVVVGLIVDEINDDNDNSNPGVATGPVGPGTTTGPVVPPPSLPPTVDTGPVVLPPTVFPGPGVQ